MEEEEWVDQDSIVNGSFGRGRDVMACRGNIDDPLETSESVQSKCLKSKCPKLDFGTLILQSHSPSYNKQDGNSNALPHRQERKEFCSKILLTIEA